MSEDDYCECFICANLLGNPAGDEDVEHELREIAEAHPGAFENVFRKMKAMKTYISQEGQPLIREHHHAEGEAMNVGFRVKVKPSHEINKDGDTVIRWETTIPKFIMDNFGCSKDQIRRDIKTHGATGIVNACNNGRLNYDQLPELQKKEEDEDKIVG